MFKKNKKNTSIIDLNKLYFVQEYLLKSKNFFSLFENILNSVDTTSVDSLGDFYCDIKLLFDDFKKEVLDNDNFK